MTEDEVVEVLARVLEKRILSGLFGHPDNFARDCLASLRSAGLVVVRGSARNALVTAGKSAAAALVASGAEAERTKGYDLIVALVEFGADMAGFLGNKQGYGSDG